MKPNEVDQKAIWSDLLTIRENNQNSNQESSIVSLEINKEFYHCKAYIFQNDKKFVAIGPNLCDSQFFLYRKRMTTEPNFKK